MICRAARRDCDVARTLLLKGYKAKEISSGMMERKALQLT